MTSALADDCGIYEEAPVGFADVDLSAAPYRGADVSRYVLYTSAPGWMKDVRSRLNQLGTLRSGWDSYSARPIAKFARDAALQLLQEISLPSTPCPSVVPTSDGSIQLEW